MKSNNDILLQSKIREIIKIQQQSTQKTIYISEFIQKNGQCGIDSDFIIICIDNTLIIIEETELKYFYSFFSENQNSTLYTLDENIRSKIEKVLNLQLNFSNEFDKNLLKIEISSLASQFGIKTNENRMQVFYKMIFDAISGFLITKTHKKSVSTDKFARFFVKHANKIENQDEYVELRYLSNGCKNNVVLIYHIESENLYILKLFFGEEGSDKLYEREVNNYMKIQNFFSPRFLGSTKYYSFKNIVIEYIPGQTLDKVNMKNLEIEKKIKIMFQIMIAIVSLHLNGFIYRDLKPNNIILNENGSISIIDFDRICKENDDYEFTKDFQHCFIAPEIIEGQKQTKKADIYSIGKMIEYIFLDEFILLKELSDRCTSEESKRPNIFEIIELFYFEYVSQISLIDETDTIQKYGCLIHPLDFFWYCLSEDKHPISQFYLSVFHNDMTKKIQYLTYSADHYYSLSQLSLGKIYYENKHINECIYYFILAANQNEPEALYELGKIYSSDQFFPRNLNKAIHYYTLAAKLNYTNAQIKLGDIYSRSKYAQLDINKAIYYYKLAANQKSTYALHELGVIYLSKDLEQALYYFTLAADANDSNSLYALGYIYYTNKYIPRNISKAIYYFTLAANLNNSEAQFNLGSIYILDQYKRQDIKKSLYYLNLASNLNNWKAQFFLGVIYFYGKCVKLDINKAIHYFTLSSKQNYPNALYVLGIIYFSYVNPRNIDKSIYYLTLAANLNFADAQFILGYIYDESNLVPKDIQRAIYYYLLAANQNEPRSLCKIGLFYYSGEYNFTQDIVKSIRYLTLSANQNNKDAQCLLGLIYKRGEKVPRDIKKAIHFLTLSANQKHYEAQYKLGKIYLKGKYIEQDIKKSLYYLSYSADRNYKYSQYYLAKIYYENIYVERDMEKSIHYFQLASNNHIPEAGFCLGCIYMKEIDNISRDIDKSIYYFKEGSSFNHNCSKNNLGVIYMIIKNSPEIAAEYFQEAINQKDDHIAMYNLAQLLFYGQSCNSNIDKIIELLIKSSNKMFRPAKLLLCLAIMKKISSISLENISKETKKHGNNNKSLDYFIYQSILKE